MEENSLRTRKTNHPVRVKCDHVDNCVSLQSVRTLRTTLGKIHFTHSTDLTSTRAVPFLFTLNTGHVVYICVHCCQT